MSRKEKISAEKKIALVRRYLKGELSISKSGREGNVDGATICRWIARSMRATQERPGRTELESKSRSNSSSTSICL